MCHQLQRLLAGMLTYYSVWGNGVGTCSVPCNILFCLKHLDSGLQQLIAWSHAPPDDTQPKPPMEWDSCHVSAQWASWFNRHFRSLSKGPGGTHAHPAANSKMLKYLQYQRSLFILLDIARLFYAEWGACLRSFWRSLCYLKFLLWGSCSCYGDEDKVSCRDSPNALRIICLLTSDNQKS